MMPTQRETGRNRNKKSAQVDVGVEQGSSGVRMCMTVSTHRFFPVDCWICVNCEGLEAMM